MIKKAITLFFFLSALFATRVSAQLVKANRFYHNFEYASAIPYYLKVVKKESNTMALQNLANCYRLTKNYSEAEVFYAKAVQQPGIDPLNFFYYGLVLKNNKKYEEASRQFDQYVKLAPGDKIAELSTKSIHELKQLMEQPGRFKVNNVSTLNTAHSEFAPAFYKNGLLFTTDREEDLVNFELSKWNKHPYFNLYYAESASAEDKNAFKTPKKNSQKESLPHHDGFSTFNAGKSQVFFTRIEGNAVKGKTVQPHIYFSKTNNGKWDSPQLISLANDTVWVSHPSLSSDGITLYFSSDMPGGFGGKDLYVSKRQGDTWGPAQNLGPAINTILDEGFPYIRKDNILFFSSTGHPGLGGFDIFSTSNSNGQWSQPKNLGAPLNSSTDDFSIIFSDDYSSGYFSSDRPEGMGADDIYSFTTQRLVEMKGKILIAQDLNAPAKKMEIMLLSEDGKVIAVTTTDDFGFFKFENLDPDVQYFVKMDETDPQFNPDTKYYLTNEKNEIVRATVINDRGEKFVFQKLPADLSTLAPDSLLDNQLKIAGTLLIGDNPSKPYAFKKVELLNEKGEVVKVGFTNAFGSFVFTELNPELTYFVRADENDPTLAPGTKITLTTLSAKEVLTVKAGSKGGFRFRLLKGDVNELVKLKVEDSQLRMDLKGKLYADTASRPLSNIKIVLLNEKGKEQQAVITKADGSFLFSGLPFDQSFLVDLDEGDKRLKDVKKIIMATESGAIIKIIYLNKTPLFKFQILPGEYKKLEESYVDDPWLKVLKFSQKEKTMHDSITIIENIYYNLDDYAILPEAMKVLDKVINLMKNDPRLQIDLGSHTDSRASDGYNLTLSQKRAKAAVDYITSTGIETKRITGRGYGESKLMNHCSNGVECTEQEHARNRRTEFRVRYK